jgi:hypothetical protein
MKDFGMCYGKKKLEEGKEEFFAEVGRKHEM